MNFSTFPTRTVAYKWPLLVAFTNTRLSTQSVTVDKISPDCAEFSLFLPRWLCIIKTAARSSSAGVTLCGTKEQSQDCS